MNRRRFVDESSAVRAPHVAGPDRVSARPAAGRMLQHVAERSQVLIGPAEVEDLRRAAQR